MSFMGKSLPTTQMLSLAMGTLYRKFMEKDIKNFDDFHVAILETFKTLNAAFPGKHYDVPPPNKVQEIFEKWNVARESEKKKLFIDFMKASASMSKFDDSAMAAKRAGETLPQLNTVKGIPVVLFVPFATLLAIIFAKLFKNMFLENVAS